MLLVVIIEIGSWITVYSTKGNSAWPQYLQYLPFASDVVHLISSYGWNQLSRTQAVAVEEEEEEGEAAPTETPLWPSWSPILVFVRSISYLQCFSTGATPQSGFRNNRGSTITIHHSPPDRRIRLRSNTGHAICVCWLSCDLGLERGYISQRTGL